jgi:hypothetical protein
MLESQHGRLSTRAHAEFGVRTGQMILDCAQAQEKLLTDFFVAQPLRDQFENLQFAGTDWCRRGIPGSPLAGDTRDECASKVWRKNHVSTRNLSHGSSELLG